MGEKVLIVGASGSLGRVLMNDFSRSFEVSGTYNRNSLENLIRLDIRDANEVRSVFKKEKPDIVLITAAKTNVEECEKSHEDSYEVNFIGIKNIISNCKGRKVVFYSTDGVFDGSKSQYFETDVPNPLNNYGYAKAESEKIVLDLPNSLVCRSSRFYGLDADSPKYLNKIISSLNKEEIIKAPIDTSGNFTFIPDISMATIKLVEGRKSGIYHTAGDGFYSLYDAALKVAEIFKFNSSLVEPVEKNYFNSIVKRPSSPLNTDKLRKEGIFMKNLDEGLMEIKSKNEK